MTGKLITLPPGGPYGFTVIARSRGAEVRRDLAITVVAARRLALLAGAGHGHYARPRAGAGKATT